MKRILIAALSLLAFTACEQDSYDSGTGKYSLMTGDFADVNTNSSGAITSFTTDDGSEYTLTESVKTNWASRADSSYRAKLYYNKVEEDGMAELVSISSVPVLNIAYADTMMMTVYTDPVNLESVWMSKNGKYLNIGLYLKVGTTDDTSAYQTLGMVCDSVVRNDDGTNTLMLTLYHNQGEVPEYYSQKYYLSIRKSDLIVDPFSNNTADSVYMTVNTYSGEVTKKIAL